MACHLIHMPLSTLKSCQQCRMLSPTWFHSWQQNSPNCEPAAFELFCCCFFKQNIFAFNDFPQYKQIQRALKPVGDVWISPFSTFLPKFWLLWGKTLGEIIPAPPKPSSKGSWMHTQIKQTKLFLNRIFLLAIKWEIIYFMGVTISLWCQSAQLRITGEVQSII